MGENNNALQYTGRENDENGLYYYRARYYDPGLKRFITSDPIGLKGGLNMYAYVGNNPLTYADPFGLLPVFPPQVYDYLGDFFGGAGDFGSNYQDMREAGWKGGDKYFHCKANCEASQRGLGGRNAACLISDTKEWWDQNVKGYPASDTAADQAANQYGRNQGSTNPGMSCAQLCAPYRPPGLPAQF